MKTPQSNRPYVVIYGQTNSGKSSLFNAIVNYDAAIVSATPGTTTDPITKSMELLPFGPIVLVDTAGLNDESTLGAKRQMRTKEMLSRTDFALYAIDFADFNEKEYENFKELLEEQDIPHLTVFTKADLYGEKEDIPEYDNCVKMSTKNAESVDILKEEIAKRLEAIAGKEEPLVGSLVPKGGMVVLVCPIDSEAPKGRIILPQVQTIRDCLDHGIRCMVVTPDNLAHTLKEAPKVNLVVTDAKVFKEVAEIVPQDTPLTAFSILMARQKGDIEVLIKGVKAVSALQDGAKILIAEACTHNRTHEDIGQVKIPAMIRKITGKELHFSFACGREFPEDLSSYQLIIHCGSCMITRKETMHRIGKAVAANVPITNYGVLQAYGSGILDRLAQLWF